MIKMTAVDPRELKRGVQLQDEAIDLATRIFKFGYLQIPDTGEQALLDAARSLGGAAQIRWTTLLADTGIPRCRSGPCPSLVSAPSLTGTFAGTDLVVHFDAANARSELVRDLTNVNSWSAWERIDKQTELDLPKGHRREDFWDNVLSTLAATASSIVVFDRYCGEEILDTTPSGIGWFLHKVETLPNPPKIEIVTASRDPRADATAMKAKLRKVAHQLTIRGCIAPHSDFQRFGHDRHIRFGRRVVQLASGLTFFSGERLSQAVGWKYKYLQDKAITDREMGAKNSPRRVTFG